MKEIEVYSRKFNNDTYWQRINFTGRFLDNNNLDNNDVTLSFLHEMALKRHLNFTVLEKNSAANFTSSYLADPLYLTFLKSLRLADMTLLWIPELIFKATATIFISSYGHSRNQLSKAKGLGNIGWAVATIMTGLLNICLGQPLFFLGNVINHAQNVIDGGVNFFLSPFYAAYNYHFRNPEKKYTYKGELIRIAGSSIKSVAIGAVALVVDALVGGVCYAITMFSGGAAAPFLTPIATSAQSIVAAPAANIVSVLSLALKGFISNVVSKLIKVYLPNKILGYLKQASSPRQELSSYESSNDIIIEESLSSDKQPSSGKLSGKNSSPTESKLSSNNFALFSNSKLSNKSPLSQAPAEGFFRKTFF